MDLESELARLVAANRRREAAHDRARERDLRLQAAAEASWIGHLVDLAESGAAVTVRTAGGRLVHGRIDVVGRDFFGMETSMGRTLVPLNTAVTLRRVPGTPVGDVTGDRAPARLLALGEHLGDLAPQRPRVALEVIGEPMLVAGILRGAGVDVLTVQVDADPPVTVYAPLSAVSLAVVLDSG